MQKRESAKNTKLLALILVFIPLSFAAGYFFEKMTEVEEIGFFKENHQKGHQLISPLIDCEENTSKHFRSFILKIKKDIKKLIPNNNKTIVSVYFRDLNNGPNFGLNQNEKFAPASLTKIPFLMAMLKYAEEDSGLLDKKIKSPYDGKATYTYGYNRENKIERNQQYSIKNLLERMIIHSDNVATDIIIKTLEELSEKTKKIEYREVFNILSIKEHNLQTNPYIMVKDIAAFFRILYNASHLNRKYSEEALRLLTKTNFNVGLTKYLPKDVVVAHKFGEIGGDVEYTNEAHDCGIIYSGDNPYILCVMTRGGSYEQLNEIIAKISKLIYERVNL